MNSYLQLISDILSNGIDRPDRTGIGSRSLWGGCLRFDLSSGFPIITTRKVAFRIAFEETMFFLRGDTDTKSLEQKSINIWKNNTTRQFLDNRGLYDLPEGNMGKGYGFQWRNFGGTSYANGVDQLLELVNGLTNDPNGRRHIITAWNPQQLCDMALPPCHLYQQYQILDGKLNSSFVMRSTDVMYGLPYNIMSYAFINVAISKLLNIEPGELVFFGNDLHIYSNQLEIAREQISREPRSLPTLTISKQIDCLDDILSLQFSDIIIDGYDPYPDFTNKPPMAT